MTAPSPVNTAGALATFAISTNGKAIDLAIQVVSLDVWTGVNKLPKARLVVSDGSPESEDFPISASATFVPGATLSIAIGYDSTNASVFTGVIYKQGLEVSANAPSRLVIEATDQAMAMTLARHNAIYENLTDSALIGTLIDTAKLSKAVTATTTTQPSIVQYYSTDWDLMVVRAQVNGMVVITEAGKVTVAPPATGGAPVLTVTYGQSLLDFQAEMDASTQYTASAIQSFSWDPATQAVAKSGNASSSVSEPGNLSSAQLAKVFNIAQYPQQTAGTLATADLTSWSSAELVKSQLAKIRGRATFQGSTLAKTGSMIALAGLGSRFNGNYYVSGVHQQVAEGLWQTSVELGLSADWFSAAAPDIAAPGASGQLPPIANLQTGLVKKLDKDPDGEFRVYVELPILQAGGTLGVWARLGTFYGFTSIGAEFYPEIGAEVVVAFMNGDPRFPVILGSLFSKKNPPPVSPTAQNSQKCIVTQSKLRIDFFDDLPAVEVSTPGKQSVRLDDKAKTVTVKDMNGNTITMGSSGITIDSAANLTLSAKRDISVSAGGNLTMKATGNATLSGLEIKQSAQTGFTAQGNSEVTVKSSGMLVVQGALVKIN